MLTFRLLGIQVRVQPFFWILAFLIGPTLGGSGESDVVPKTIAWIAIVFTGVLAHELGHAFAGRAFGLVPAIELHGLGGLTRWENARELSPLRSIAVSLAGPGVGIAVGLAASAVWIATGASIAGVPEYVLESLVWVNLGWGVLNLLPMQPLDGGHVMASTLELVIGDRGRVIARVLSLAVAAALVALGLYTGAIFMAVLVIWLSLGNFRALQVEREVGPDRALVAELGRAEEELRSGNLASAESRARSVADRARSEAVKRDALTLTAYARLSGGDPVSAMRAIEEMPASRPAPPALRGTVLLALGDAGGAAEALAAALAEQQGRFLEERFVEAVVKSGRFDVAVRALDGARGRTVAPDTLEKLEEAAYRAGAFREASVFGQILWETDRRPTRAYNVACALTRAGEPGLAMDWLERARKAGFTEIGLLDGDEDLAVLRARPDWGTFRRAFDP